MCDPRFTVSRRSIDQIVLLGVMYTRSSTTIYKDCYLVHDSLLCIWWALRYDGADLMRSGHTKTQTGSSSL